MSLLLDALKKAADDKLKAEKANTSSESSSSVPIVEEPTSNEAIVENQDGNPADNFEIEEPSTEVNNQDDLTLELDALDELSSDATATANDNENNSDNGDYQENINEAIYEESHPPLGSDADHVNAISSVDEAVESRYKVSNEGLSLLINKTNREVKLGKRVALISAFVLAVAIMVAGGGYYYLITQDEIASLERKHRISMQAMKAKISGEQDPDNVEIIRNLVSDSKLEAKVEFAKKHMADKNKPIKTNNTAKTEAKLKSNKPVFSIQKTNKVDLIAKELDDAWLAFDAGNYSEAKKNYQSVIEKESQNRDALLGLGAIAITEKNNIKATEYYLALLEQDPLDPIATAALSSLHFDDASLVAHEEHLKAMLEKAPQAAPLNFALGNIYAQQANWKEAQQSYFSAWQQDSDNANYLFNLAVSMDQLGKPEQALGFYKNSLQVSNNKQVSFSREAVRKRINELSGQ